MEEVSSPYQQVPHRRIAGTSGTGLLVAPDTGKHWNQGAWSGCSREKGTRPSSARIPLAGVVVWPEHQGTRTGAQVQF